MLEIAFLFCMSFVSCYTITLWPDGGGPPIPAGTCNTKHASQLALLKSKKDDPTFWVPECDKSNSYLPVQKRQNKEQFCVEPSTGSIINWKASQPKKPTDFIYCDCFVTQFVNDHTRGGPTSFHPNCDKTTGFWAPFQTTPTSTFCATPTGQTVKRDKPPSKASDCTTPKPSG